MKFVLNNLALGHITRCFLCFELLSLFMAEGLRSRYVANKDNGDRNDDLSLQLKKLQEQMREIVVKSRKSRQDRIE